MTVHVEKTGRVWTVIHSQPESRNAIDADTAEALTEAAPTHAASACP